MKKLITGLVVVITILAAPVKTLASEKIFGYYWGYTDPDKFSAYSNVMVVDNTYQLNVARSRGMKGLMIMSGTFFDCSSRPCNLRNDWMQRWQAAWEGTGELPAIKDNLVDIVGFYVMDEPEMNTNYDDYETVVKFLKLKTSLPLVMIMTYEGPMKLIDGGAWAADIRESWLDGGGKLKIPQEVDWLGFDEYGSVDLTAKLNIVADFMATRGKQVVMVGDGYFERNASPDQGTIDRKKTVNSGMTDWCLGRENCRGMVTFFWKYMPDTGLIGVKDVPDLETKLNDLGMRMLKRGIYAPKCMACGNGYNRSSGDANCDGKVDLMDFMIWKDEYLQSNGAANSNYRADFDCNGIVDLNDFLKWKDGYLRK